MSFSSYNDLDLVQYIKKRMDIKILSGILATKENILQSKKRVLDEKYNELDNINDAVWMIEDKFCNVVWNFSLEHKFSHFFNQYPNIAEANIYHTCKYNNGTDKDAVKTNIHNGNKILQLKSEIDILKNEIKIVRDKCIEGDLQYYTSILDNAELFSEEISKLIRLVSNLRSFVNNHSNTMDQNTNGHTARGFMSARKIFKQSTSHNRVLNENRIISNPNGIFIMPKEPHNVRGTVRFGRFIMKKRSIISLKFEQNLRNSK